MRHLLHLWVTSTPGQHSSLTPILEGLQDLLHKSVPGLETGLRSASFVPPNVVNLLREVQANHPSAWQVVFIGGLVHYFDKGGELLEGVYDHIDSPDLGAVGRILRAEADAVQVVRGLYPLPIAFTLPPGLNPMERQLLDSAVSMLGNIEAMGLDGVDASLVHELSKQITKAATS